MPEVKKEKIPMATNNFNDLLLHILKEVGIRLERVEGRVDRIIDQKADKSDFDVPNKRLDSIDTKLDQKADKTDIAAIAEKLDQKADKTDIAAIAEKLELKADKTDIAAIAEKLELKADKSDLDITNQKVDTLAEKVNTLTEKVDTLGTQATDFGQRLDRIEGGISTLKWVVGAEVAVIGVILAFIKAC